MHNPHVYWLPAAEDTFDETAGATVADILDPPDKLARDAKEASVNDAAARQQADPSTR